MMVKRENSGELCSMCQVVGSQRVGPPPPPPFTGPASTQGARTAKAFREELLFKDTFLHTNVTLSVIREHSCRKCLLLCIITPDTQKLRNRLDSGTNVLCFEIRLYPQELCASGKLLNLSEPFLYKGDDTAFLKRIVLRIKRENAYEVLNPDLSGADSEDSPLWLPLTQTLPSLSSAHEKSKETSLQF